MRRIRPHVGDRVRVTGAMPDEPNPVPVGAEGTVTWVNTWTNQLTEQFAVDWDNVNSSIYLLGSDPWKVVERGPNFNRKETSHGMGT